MGCRREGEGWVVTTLRRGQGWEERREEERASLVINCAGNYGDLVERMAGRVRGHGLGRRERWWLAGWR